MKSKNGAFAVVVSRYNQSITERLLRGALSTFKKRGIRESALKIIWVPGAYEIPLIAAQLAESKCYEAVICLGCVLRGETQHNHYISEAVSKGIMETMLRTGIPVIFGVLTPNTMKQALERSGKNSANKGMESVEAALEMAQLTRSLNTKHRC